MPVFQLIYRSKANLYFSDEDLIALLRECRQHNASKDITGLLLYGHGSFVQLLEGREKIVRELFFNHIAHDKRHREPVVLHRAYAPGRLFSEWSMAFRPMNPALVRDLNGFMEPDSPASGGKNLLAPLRLLELMQGFSLDMKSR